MQENISRMEDSIYYVNKHLSSIDVAPHKQTYNNSILPLLSPQSMINVLNQLKGIVNPFLFFFAIH